MQQNYKISFLLDFKTFQFDKTNIQSGFLNNYSQYVEKLLSDIENLRTMKEIKSISDNLICIHFFFILILIAECFFIVYGIINLFFLFYIGIGLGIFGSILYSILLRTSRENLKRKGTVLFKECIQICLSYNQRIFSQFQISSSMSKKAIFIRKMAKFKIYVDFMEIPHNVIPQNYNNVPQNLNNIPQNFNNNFQNFNNIPQNFNNNPQNFNYPQNLNNNNPQAFNSNPNFYVPPIDHMSQQKFTSDPQNYNNNNQFQGQYNIPSQNYPIQISDQDNAKNSNFDNNEGYKYPAKII